jgi:hypothetical protein
MTTSATLEPACETLTNKYVNDPVDMWMDIPERSRPPEAARPKPDVRPAKVLEMRQQIRSGTYDLESRIDILVERLITSLRETADLVETL